jgi:hypothetical protein
MDKNNLDSDDFFVREVADGVLQIYWQIGAKSLSFSKLR